ncbi:chymotrypsin-2-like isoform X2 [Pieris rapae]|uniref:chymotrypsin-2-like isoform X2 n=1 Tax=Pieris rapae TaxID=64459 RepID=UPI001E27E870|nr:chymotrypsin-2-like isoform X2 [Pieris rapae]XP_045487418.1 chymotrypsin-2-like isoform X2 [Pieris rapae]
MFLFEIYVFIILFNSSSGLKLGIDAKPKILGGDDAPDGAIKYQVSLQNLGSHFCGGSIIDKKWVVTAAHCMVYRPSKSFKVVVGINKLSDMGKEYTPDKVIIHEKYDKKLFTNDISLIKIEPGIELNDRVNPVDLPTTNINSGATLTLTGWGRISSDGPLPNKLQIVEVNAISVKECKIKYKLYKQPILRSNLCTRAPPREGSCQGDSGGPLVNNGTIAALVSWGTRSCGHSRVHPDVNTRVYSFVDWIKNTMSKN